MRLRLSLFVLIADCLALIVAFSLADLLRSHEPGNGRGLIVGAVLVPVYLGVAISNGAFTYDALEKAGAALDRAFSALLISATMVIFIAFYLHSTTDVSRVVFAVGTAGSAVLVAVARLAIMDAVRRRFGGPLICVVLIEDGAHCPHSPGADLLPAKEYGLSPDSRDPFARDRLGRILRNADRVIVAAQPDGREQWAIALKNCMFRIFKFRSMHVEQTTNRLQSDLEYLSNWSIWLDAAIIFRTFRVLVHARAF